MKNQYMIWTNSRDKKHNSIFVAPSHIHKYGLFTKKSFQKDDIVIEYVGEKIRNCVADSREVIYE